MAADRCYFCYDAPCVAACPTSIESRCSSARSPAAPPRRRRKTILSQNILGGMCARVCPTETLCEQACVREAAEGKPVEIGRLQRFATDALMARGRASVRARRPTGQRVAVVGAGPAGLACAHRLAMLGHAVVLFEARPKGGGLNEFGIAAYKTVEGFAQAEFEWLLGIGGIEVRDGVALGRDVTLKELAADFDAVFLGIGLGGVQGAGGGGRPQDGVRPAVDFIAELRQAADLTKLPVGRRVVVIGGGMTAIDAAVQSKLLGAAEVTIVYRRSRERMAASRYEQELATSAGVRILYNAVPLRVTGNGAVRAVEFARTAEGPEGLRTTDETFALEADQVLTAIGQRLEDAPLGLAIEDGKIRVEGRGAPACRGSGPAATVPASATT